MAARRRLVAVTQSDFDPASRYRVMQLIPYWRAAGWEVTHRPLRPSAYWRSPLRVAVLRWLHQRLANMIRRFNMARTVRLARRADVLLISRELGFGATALVKANPRMIFDFDDAIYLTQAAADVEWLCRNATTVVVGNEILATQARRWSRQVRVIPTLVRMPSIKAAPGRVTMRVGWLGSSLSIAETLFPFIGMFAQLQDDLGFEFVIISKPEPVLPESRLNYRYVSWYPGIENKLPALIDVGVMPLLDTPYQRGKCAMKLLQYMAAGLPAVASPVGINADIIRHGANGFLAGDTSAWRAALAALMTDSGLSARIGAAARVDCRARYAIAPNLPLWMDTLEAAARTSKHSSILCADVKHSI